MLSADQLISISATNSAIAVAANFARRYRSLHMIRSNQLSVVAEWWCCPLTLPLAYMAPFLSTSQCSAFKFLSFASFLGDTRAFRTLFQFALGAPEHVHGTGHSIDVCSYHHCQMPTAYKCTTAPSYTTMPVHLQMILELFLVSNAAVGLETLLELSA